MKSPNTEGSWLNGTVRATVWKRLGSDLKPPLLKEMCRTIPFAKLPAAFDDFIAGKVTRRTVVDLSE